MPSLKAGLVVVATAGVVVVGAVLVANAFASTTTYCSGCSLGSTPAVSPTENYFSYNAISVTQAKYLEIYYYAFGTQECDDSAAIVPAYSLSFTCNNAVVPTSARCHLLYGGTGTGTCWADYSTGQPAAPARDSSASVPTVAPGSPVGPSTPVFAAIGAARRAGLPSDALDAASAGMLELGNPSVGAPLVAEARRIGSIEARGFYVVPTTTNRLCAVVAELAETCTDPLSANSPFTFDVIDADGPGGAGPVAFGVAEDSVTAVAFNVAGERHTAPVHNNVFVFRARSNDSPDDFTGAVATAEG